MGTQALGTTGKAAGTILLELFFFLVMVAVAAYAGHYFITSLARSLVAGVGANLVP